MLRDANLSTSSMIRPTDDPLLLSKLGPHREAHDSAFGELIMASGHLEKVLATLDEAVVQTFYDVVS